MFCKYMHTIYHMKPIWFLTITLYVYFQSFITINLDRSAILLGLKQSSWELQISSYKNFSIQGVNITTATTSTRTISFFFSVIHLPPEKTNPNKTSIVKDSQSHIGGWEGTYLKSCSGESQLHKKSHRKWLLLNVRRPIKEKRLSLERKSRSRLIYKQI